MGTKRRKEPLEGEIVTTATIMQAVEKEAILAGDATDETYMETAGERMTLAIIESFQRRDGERKAVLLSAKGNNSGDGYVIGRRLLSLGFGVISYQLFPLEECSKLCQEKAKEFKRAGGKIIFLQAIDSFLLEEEAVVIDGFFGTGFKGKITGLMEEVVRVVNESSNFVISIDIPSGIPGDTGIAEGEAIMADLTLYLGCAKVGHFYNDGFECVGELQKVDFGMGEHYVSQITPFGYLVNIGIIQSNLGKFKRKENKYTLGQVVVVAGSPGMPGAAMLASVASLRSGAGIVRLFHRSHMEGEFSFLAPEVIRTSFDKDHLDLLKEEKKRTKALLIGPGLGRDEEARQIIDGILSIYEGLPCVLDADALFFCKTPPKGSILTPHRGELQRLLGSTNDDEITLLEKAEEYAKTHQVTVVCKGAPTTVVSCGGPKVIIPYGNPGMASGGMGDALGGIIATLLASGIDPRGSAVLGATLHALAGDLAKEIKSMRFMVASDLIEALSQIFLRNEGR